ncbi:secretory carrier-associated membrane protein 2-like isoform X1 [Anguilla anguilla]|uniref:secretory carrier-associated membrane protein 2-like isoform X1 n=1 Tax=Anguilla anguilla TaxID=7936 RepID=UPI0015A9E23B|nr:secretory carrier-associated membrane protein 2-like isoform X1 [Anguilla anguilla]
MSGFVNNPFVDPVDVNPFQDPAVTQATSTGVDNIEEFNPFSDTTAAVHQDGTTIPATVPSSQPAVLQPSVEPSPQATAAVAQANLLRQQEELERKAAELDRKEQELQSRGASTGRENNWPPLPKSFPIKPCFYQDFSEEIPLEYQKVCKMMYYLWMFNCVTLFLNVLACLAYFTVDAAYGVDFGLAILWFILFSPCSFLCWYRPVYKAFKSDSSFSFFFFFFVFFIQVVVFIIQSVGIPKWGNRFLPSNLLLCSVSWRLLCKCQPLCSAPLTPLCPSPVLLYISFLSHLETKWCTAKVESHIQPHPTLLFTPTNCSEILIEIYKLFFIFKFLFNI